MKRYQQASRERTNLDWNNMTEQERADAITLSATRFVFRAVPGYRTFHTRQCGKLNGLTGIRGFARYEEAIRAGFQPCRQYRPSHRQDALLSIPIYNQARENEQVSDIMALCEAQGFQCTLEENTLLIETKAGRWRFDVLKRPIFVEHQHTEGSIKGPSSIHWQPRMFLSLQDVVAYIVRHDAKLTVENNEDAVNHENIAD